MFLAVRCILVLHCWGSRALISARPKPFAQRPRVETSCKLWPWSSTPWPWNKLQSSPLCRSLPFTCHSWLQVQKSHSEAVAEDGSSFKLYTCICSKMYSKVGTCTQKIPKVPSNFMIFMLDHHCHIVPKKLLGDGQSQLDGLAVSSCRWNQQWFQRMESTRRVSEWWHHGVTQMGPGTSTRWESLQQDLQILDNYG
jgi:hypothetical protein